MRLPYIIERMKIKKKITDRRDDIEKKIAESPQVIHYEEEKEGEDDGDD